jgi:predicted RNA methylase
MRVSSGRRRGQRFDAQHGVVTEALIFLGELDPDEIGDALEDATHYEPTPVAEFEALLRALPIDRREYTFVDLGAGMGRVMLLASLHPFRQVVGVEVSPALCETARDNLVRWRQRHEELGCKDLRVVRADAGGFRFPRGNLVVYLYNPFGEATLERVLQRLESDCSGTCFVIYHTPVHSRAIEDRFEIKPLADLGFGAVYALPSIPRSFCP